MATQNYLHSLQLVVEMSENAYQDMLCIFLLDRILMHCVEDVLCVRNAQNYVYVVKCSTFKEYNGWNFLLNIVIRFKIKHF